MSSGSQSQLCFIDTNVWLYAFIPSQDTIKSTRAKTIIHQEEIIISTQVINEVCVNLIKKAQFDELMVRQLIDSFYDKYKVMAIERGALLKSSELRQRLQISYWDSLIVSSALLGSADVLYTEDMGNGIVIENRLRIINPFGS